MTCICALRSHTLHHTEARVLNLLYLLLPQVWLFWLLIAGSATDRVLEKHAPRARHFAWFFFKVIHHRMIKHVCMGRVKKTLASLSFPCFQ